MKFTIQEKVKPKKKKLDCYKLVIENMHGDADAYTNNTFYIESNQLDMLEAMVNFLNWAQKSWAKRDDIEDKENELMEKFEAWPEQFVERDATSDHQYVCRPALKKLTYFDKDGEEFDVKIEE